MDNLKEAYERLGLSESADRSEVEKVFEILLRQSRARQSASTPGGEQDELEAKLQACRMIIQADDRRKVEEKSRERYNKWGKFAGTAERIDDFVRIYKTRVILSLVALVVLIVGINAYANHREEQKRLAALPPVDLSILMIGNFMTDDPSGDTEALEKAMTDQFPEFKRLDLQLVYLPPQGDAGIGGSDMAYQQKAMAILATTHPDIYITDKASFEWLTGGGAMKSLDREAESVLKPLLPKGAALKGKSEDDPTEHIYGIDVTASRLVNQLPLKKQQMIVSLRMDTNNTDKALQIIEGYLNNQK